MTEPIRQTAPAERPPLTVLAARPVSALLARIIPTPDDSQGPARVSVAAFQSAV